MLLNQVISLNIVFIGNIMLLNILFLTHCLRFFPFYQSWKVTYNINHKPSRQAIIFTLL